MDLVVEEFYYLCSGNKGTDQLHGYRTADLHLCFRICKKRFSHGAAHIVSFYEALAGCSFSWVHHSKIS